MAVRIAVLPSPICLYDDPVQVKVEGLSALQAVTLRASLEDETAELFQSFAYYRADRKGELDLTDAASLGGSYSGVEPMGLLWSLEAKTPFRRLAKRNVLTPFYVTYEVYEGHGVSGQLLGRCISERWFLAEGVERIPVREGRLKATLFLPAGPGPFPGLIDLYGTGGGLVEHRASLLASRGFATLALAYLAFEDFPAFPEFLELDYFGEAVEFLQKQQQVNALAIGVLGISKGADMALALATFWPGIKAAVSISGTGFNTFSPLKVKGLTIPALSYNLEKMKAVGDAVDFSEILDDPRDPAALECRIPVEKSSSKFLFLSGQDDRNWQSEAYCQEAVQRLQQNGHHVEFYCYSGAGHLLEPPYLPLCYASINKPFWVTMLWGGKWREHAKAQEDAWQRLQNFFRQHLQDCSIKSHL
ncbi:PREDICTED: acyl-coenzyme A thioesterase 1-like [Gekko japonicus]|uniref:Acyl-coenzyme A thioesterase 1-like n=1 Tax=Gekko japonicus TaxID=146911 RepID=A0ABM1K3R1_GEKJA|nr:PREDICTED: acyl-coenzyme A thioesterase 1-like [Gekko japonicus]